MYLDFKEISKIPFKNVLDWLQIPYEENEGKLKGEGFIASTDKNLYFNPTGEDKGSIINFLSAKDCITLREAAAKLKKQFEEKPPEKELPEYQLYYHKFLAEQGISEELAQEFEVGYCKKGIMGGKIAFKVRDEKGDKAAYIGKNLTDGWYFPKNYQNDHLYNLWKVKQPKVILVPDPFDVLRLHALGFPAIALMGTNMTEAQEKMLRRFIYIYLIHPDPDNIVVRLARHSMVKAPRTKKVKEMTKEDVVDLF